jgi:Protein of unknown function (DUF2889)
LPLPPPAPRAHRHTRHVVFRGYRRDDGLWDIEAEMRDTKTQVFDIPGDGSWQPGEPIHDMAIRVTIDDAMVVRDIAVAMDGTPHAECPQAQAPMQRMIGCSMARGWRKAIAQNLGGTQGCTHLRELLFNMGTAAFQTLPENALTTSPDTPPPHLGTCLAWDFDGPVVQRHHPVFFRRPPARNKADSAPPDSIAPMP